MESLFFIMLIFFACFREFKTQFYCRKNVKKRSNQ